MRPFPLAAAISLLLMQPPGVAHADDTSNLVQSTSPQFIDLGGKVTYLPSQLEVIGTPRKPIRFVPFTLEEITKFAPPSRIRKTRPAGRPETNYEVLVMRAKDASPRFVLRPPSPQAQTSAWVPITKYVEQLNQYEKFLNQYGFTLRDGPFQKRGLRNGPDNTTPSPVSRDTGLHFTLLPAPLNGSTAAGHVRMPVLKKDFYPFPIPEEFERGDINMLDAKVNQAGLAGRSAGWRVDAMPKTPATRDLGKMPLGLQMVKGLAKSYALPQFTPGVPTQCAPQACTYQFNVNASLSKIGEDIINNAQVGENKHCRIDTPLGCSDNPYTDPGGATPLPWDRTPIYAQQQYSYLFQKGNQNLMQQFLTGYQDPCQMKALFGQSVFDQLYVAPSTSSEGDVTVATGVDAKSFFEGTMLLKTTNVRDCLPNPSANKWFNASFCATFASDNSYTQAAGFHIDNSAGLLAKVTVFGLNYSLVDGSAETLWNQSVSQAELKPGAPAKQMTEPNTKSSLNPQQNLEHFIGPVAVIPIGPVPLTVKSFLDASIEIGKANTTFAPIPLTAGAPGQGSVGIDVGAGGKVDVGLDAGIDLLVASAGVEGDLILIKGDVNGSIVTTVNPLENWAEAAKTYGFNATTLAGVLKAYVEVDMLVYTKRWDVEIAKFDGIPGNIPVTTKKQTAHSVIPSTATVSCN